jgi:hypothetical protein
MACTVRARSLSKAGFGSTQSKKYFWARLRQRSPLFVDGSKAGS